MNKYLKFPIILLAILMIVTACKKYTDPSGKDIDLQNKYCNVPYAANYNHGFPGMPDSSVCVYSYDYFKGNWIFVDSVYLEDLTFSSTATLLLDFVIDNSVIDTFRNRLKVNGLCSNKSFDITANKYGLALTDTLIENSNGFQYYCQTTDSLAGFFKVSTDSINGTRMYIELNVQGDNGNFIHKGYATKQ